MKKLLLAAVVLALMVGGAFAQDWTSTDTPDDTVYVRFQVHMIGFEFTVTMTDASGASHSSSATFTWAREASTDTIGMADQEVSPCDFLHAYGWIENTGGLTADFEIAHVGGDTVTAPNNWSINSGSSGASDCSNASENTYCMDYVYELADGTADGFTGAFAAIPAALDDVDEYSDLVAEDPSHPTDGSYADQDDILETHIGLRVPSSTTTHTGLTGNPETHIIKVAIRGEIAD